ncbi:hypothetical protein IscW_ISCW011187 [Ixodes scapularis]|uniref:Uncharacterized protein n=1 Tax=Ixodes scapularis TaxID=6945 RepID=B7Q4N3_IXOSC|nr:hypothetical protein IscW_ISCW011187 [Ixodes scapularis]|eukprot:XP_002411575.1 hypothetical protein IscW_ISCW011187 [Ixodes scapularis]
MYSVDTCRQSTKMIFTSSVHFTSYMMGESLTQSILPTTDTALMKMPVDSTQCIMKWQIVFQTEYTENEIVQPTNHPTNQSAHPSQAAPVYNSTVENNFTEP